MSRTIIGLVAVGVAVIAIALGVAWRGKLNDQAVIGQNAAPAPQSQASAGTSRPAPPAPAPSTATPPAAAPSAPTVPVPTFDVARIGPDGRAVIAGRAAPGAKIVLLDGGKEIASGVADQRGEWVILAQEPPLAVGQHELRVVQHIEGRAPVTSEQVVVAMVPAPPAGTSQPAGKEETLVMIAPPKGAATLLQPPSPAGVPKSGDLQLSTLDYDQGGNVTVTGRAAPGTSVRVYINDRLIGEDAADASGRWKVTPAAPIEPGKHTLRLDRLSPDGKPAARLELPFERPVPTSAVADKRQLTIVRGDNLWNIARAHYGEGLRYTVIFDANKSQIRDPNLIYPGQIFSLPKVD